MRVTTIRSGKPQKHSSEVFVNSLAMPLGVACELVVMHRGTRIELQLSQGQATLLSDILKPSTPTPTPNDDGGRTAAGDRSTADDGAEAERLLEAAQEAQTAFWHAVRELEAALDIEIDGTRDLSNETVESLSE